MSIYEGSAAKGDFRLFWQCLEYFVSGKHDTLPELNDIISTNALGMFKHISDNSELFGVLSRRCNPLRFG